MNKINMRGGMICRDKTFTVHSVINNNSWPKHDQCLYHLKKYLCHHTEWMPTCLCFRTHHQPPPKPTSDISPLMLTEWKIYNVTWCVYMIAINSHWLQMDKTDIRGKRKRKKGRAGREVEQRGGSSLPFLSCSFIPFTPPTLLSLLHTVFTMPFRYKMRIKLPLHIRHGIPSAQLVYMKRCA